MHSLSTKMAKVESLLQ